MDGAVLALDTGSPQVSVAVAYAGALRTERAARLERSSTQLLGLIDQVLREAELRPDELGGVLALRGPGSFTGLRIGLATALGLHQALGLRATAISSFQALAAAADLPGCPILAVSDALRGEWSALLFPRGDPASPAGEPLLLTPAGISLLAARSPSRLTVTGFGLSPLRALGEAIRWREASGLAGPAVRWFTSQPRTWEAGLLSDPIYSRPPAVSQPKPRRGAPVNVS